MIFHGGRSESTSASFVWVRTIVPARNGAAPCERLFIDRALNNLIILSRTFNKGGDCDGEYLGFLRSVRNEPEF